MNTSLQVILFWMLITFAPYSIPLVSCSHNDDRIIAIDKAGVSSIECCVYGKCHCSNLSLALEHIQRNTDIRIMSDVSLQGAINDSDVTMEIFKNLTDVYDISSFVWLHEFILQFSHIITDCVNNLYGPAQVFMCCDDYSCDERYEYIVDSTHNNITMISNNTVASCPNGEMCTLQIIATANVNSILVSTQIDMKIILSNNVLAGYCEKDIAHVHFSSTFNGTQCFPLSCNLNNHNLKRLPKGIHCFNNYFTVIPGYWFSNGFTKFVKYCPQGHCNSTFNLYDSIYKANNSKSPFPNSNDQCIANWTGLACGECDNENYIIHDSSSCVPSKKCTFKNSSGLIIFFFVSLLYWTVVISFIFVLLHFKFDITAGYAYGIIFYYSILEQTVNASYVGAQNNLNAPIIITLLTVLSSIGNMKPPFQLLKLCFWKNAKMVDHMFLTYIHPVIVTSLIVTIFILARNSVTVARTIGRYVNSKSICILLMLSYSSVSYTSVQLFRLLTVYTNYECLSGPEISESCAYSEWRLYLSPTIKYWNPHDDYFIYVMIYSIVALLCELFIGIGFPLVLAFQQHLTRYLNINFTSVKPIMDQFKGCYREECCWFAAYYLLCRQIIYVVDICTDFAPIIKFPIMLSVYVLIIMVHVWLQPYKQRKLNVLDSSILIILMIVFIGEYTSYGSTVILWIMPMVLFINCVAFSSRFKYLLIPISCLGIVMFCLVIILTPYYYTQLDTQLDDYQSYDNQSYDFLFDYQSDDEFDNPFYFINFVILCISSLVFLAYLIYALKYLCATFIKKCRKPPEFRLININEQNENLCEDSDSNDVI